MIKIIIIIINNNTLHWPYLLWSELSHYLFLLEWRRKSSSVPTAMLRPSSSVGRRNGGSETRATYSILQQWLRLRYGLPGYEDTQFFRVHVSIPFQQELLEATGSSLPTSSYHGRDGNWQWQGQNNNSCPIQKPSQQINGIDHLQDLIYRSVMSYISK